MIVAGIAPPTVHAPSANALHRVSMLVTHAATLVRQHLCGLRGHLYVLHSAPGHLSLRCFACNAQTRGWTIDVRPAFRRAGPPQARVVASVQQHLSDGPTDMPRPLRPAA